MSVETGVEKRPHVAFVLTWPDMKNAEYEVSKRIIRASRQIGIDISIVDNIGRVIFSSVASFHGTRHILGYGDCDFVISSHFESPKLYDIYSYSALWNPLEFLFEWGYERTSIQIASHDDLISCGSATADGQAISLLHSMKRPPSEPLPLMYHSLSGPFLKPRVTSDSRLCYLGINWETSTRTYGRYHNLLKKLDDDDLVIIYGPDEFNDVRPWAGYINYAGELPFDGVSVQRAINKHGVCLALSSKKHISSGITSNRFFEGIAAGAVVISSGNAMLQEAFGDSIFFLDNTASEKGLVDQISDYLDQVRSDPEGSMKKVIRAQEILMQDFALDVGLRGLVSNHQARKSISTSRISGRRPRIHVLAISEALNRKSLEVLIENLTCQRHVTLDITLIVDRSLSAVADIIKLDLLSFGHIACCSVLLWDFHSVSDDFSRPWFRIKRSGTAIFDALRSVDAPEFALLRIEDTWFGDHLAELSLALSYTKGSLIARSGSIVETEEADGSIHRQFESLDFGQAENLMYANDVRHSGRALYSSQVIPLLRDSFFASLDGQEHNLLNLVAFKNGPLSQSSKATYVFRETVHQQKPSPLTPVEIQHQLIRDINLGDTEAKIMMAGAARPSRIVFSSPGGAGVHWDRFSVSSSQALALELETWQDLGHGSSARQFIFPPFFGDEDEGALIQGESLQLELSIAFDIENAVLALEFDKVFTGLNQLSVLINGVLAHFIPKNEGKLVTIDLPSKALKNTIFWRISMVPDLPPDERQEIMLKRFGFFSALDAISAPEKGVKWLQANKNSSQSC